jgi:hypothetical protein
MLSADETLGPVISDILNEVKITLDSSNVQLTLKIDKALLEKAGKKKTSNEE